VKSGLDPTAFTMEAVLDRVAKHGDLYEGVLGGKQSLTTALKSLT
jgi:DNA primase